MHHIEEAEFVRWNDRDCNKCKLVDANSNDEMRHIYYNRHECEQGVLSDQHIVHPITDKIISKILNIVQI